MYIFLAIFSSSKVTKARHFDEIPLFYLDLSVLAEMITRIHQPEGISLVYSFFAMIL